MNFLRTAIGPILTLALTGGPTLVAPGISQAQNINQPKSHLPNDIANKVSRIRLKALVTEAESEEEVEDEFDRLGISNFGPPGCSVNLGNTLSTGPGSNVEKDVVIVGDVINYCQ